MSENTSYTQPLIEHLIELRKRFLLIFLGLIITFIVVVPFSQTLYTFLAEPLLKSLPNGTNMIATDVVAPFFVPIKVTLMVALLISLPNSLYQIWAFVAPALYQNEKRLIFPLILSSTTLFFVGMAFAYFLVFPVIFRFLANVTPEGVSMATDIDKYFSFVLGMFFAFGTAFELPIVIILLSRLGMVSQKQLKNARPYIIVGAFIIAAIITPPDIVSQILLAIPLIILYEIGIIISRVIKPSQHQKTNVGIK